MPTSTPFIIDPELIKAMDIEGQRIELSDLKHDIDISTTGHSSPTNGSHAQLQVLEHSQPQEGTTFQELAPIDRGFGAWTFCASAFVAEMFIWGFLFRSALSSKFPPTRSLGC